MQITRPLIMCLQISRCISSSSAYLNLNRESKVMKKIMHGSHKSKKKWYDTGLDSRSTTNVNQAKKSLPAHLARRMMIRDKLFMKHITDQISMGEAASIINGNIEITHVKITPDFNFVHVYWIDITDDPSSINEEVLQKCSKIIRHELSQLRVIGIVPPILFIKNKQLSITKEVERRLATINLEEICETVSHPEEMQLVTSDTNTVNQTSCKESVTSHNFEMDGSIQLPMMRHDILGLDHYKIMSRITTSISKSKEAAQRRMFINTNTNKNPGDPVPKEVPDFLARKEEQKIFSDFLINRKREEKRKYRMKQKLLNISKKEIEKSDYEEEYNDDGEYSDEFEDEVSMNDFNEDK